MTTTRDAATLREIMSRYDEARERWFSVWGSYDGFDHWFRGQTRSAAPDTDSYDRWAATDRRAY